MITTRAVKWCQRREIVWPRADFACAEESRVFIPTLYDRRTRSGVKSLELLQDCHPSHCWHKAVPMDTRLRDPFVLTAEEPPTGKGADAYRSALAWLLDKADVRKEAA